MAECPTGPAVSQPSVEATGIKRGQLFVEPFLEHCRRIDEAFGQVNAALVFAVFARHRSTGSVGIKMISSDIVPSDFSSGGSGRTTGASTSGGPTGGIGKIGTSNSEPAAGRGPVVCDVSMRVQTPRISAIAATTPVIHATQRTTSTLPTGLTGGGRGLRSTRSGGRRQVRETCQRARAC
jgi:hypothetical protein